MSPSVERLLGYSVDEFLEFTFGRRGAVEAPSSRLLEQLGRQLCTAFYAGDESARAQTHEVQAIRKDGSIVPTEIAITLITDARGRSCRSKAPPGTSPIG